MYIVSKANLFNSKLKGFETVKIWRKNLATYQGYTLTRFIKMMHIYGYSESKPQNADFR